MKIHTRLARVAVASTTMGLALTGAVVATSTSAQALSETTYGLGANAYGTRVIASMVGASSDRTAYSEIACTRVVGLKRSNKVAAVSLPADNPMVHVGAVVSNTRTFKDAAAGIVAGSEATNQVASVSIGAPGTPQLTINGLKSTSRVWADDNDKLHASNTIKAAELSLIDLPDQIPAELAGPLNQLLDALDSGLNQVIQAIQDNAGTIVIPSLGEISVAKDARSVGANTAIARGAALEILLYGADTAKGGGDDTSVRVGRSSARIERGVEQGVMRGHGYGASLELLDGIVGVGKLGFQPLSCRGTDGEVRQGGTAGLNLANANQLTLGAVDSKVYGKRGKKGAANAWTQGGIAQVNLGPLQISAIQARANVRTNRLNQIVRRDIAGSTIAEVTVDGDSQGGITPETVDEQLGSFPNYDPATNSLTIPSLAKLEFFKTTMNGRRGLTTIAVRLTLLDGTPGVSVVDLGVAKAGIYRY